MKSVIFILNIFLCFQSYSQNELKDQIDKYTLPLVETNNFSGNILIQQKGIEIFSKSYGYADQSKKQPITAETVFQIASVSKTITATAIMRFVEKGLLQLNQPLSDFIPDYPNGNNIIIQHLLTHTSGIANINDLPVYDSLEQLQHTPADLIPWFKKEPIVFEPGKEYGYSNSNYTLLAFIIEKISGQAYGEFLKNEFFEPYQMLNTGHPSPGKSMVSNKAIGYEPEGVLQSKPSRSINWTVKTGNGSLYSTVKDLQNWSSKFFKGKIVKANIMQLMLTPQADKMGYGWFVSPHIGRKRYYINGRSPGFSSILSYYPESELLIIILSNNYVPLPTQMSIDFAAMVFGEPYLPLIEGNGKTTDEQIAKYCGRYQFGPDFYQPNISLTVTEKDGYLVTDWGGLYFKGGSKYIHRDYWSDIQFEETTDGTVKMIYETFTGTRLKF